MFTLRCTSHILKRLQVTEPPEQPATTALGDWFANRLNIGRQRLVLCCNERSLLCVIVVAMNLPDISVRLESGLERLLRGIGVPADQISRELREMAWFRVGKTNSRTVLGSMNEFAFMADAYIHDDRNIDLDALALWLAESPCSPLMNDRPCDVARKLLQDASSQKALH